MVQDGITFEEICRQLTKCDIPEPVITLPDVLSKTYNETAISSYLAFLLDPENNGIGTLPLEALLSLSPYKEQSWKLTSVKVEKEYYLDGRRIDIFIDSDQYIIGIEMKIFSEEQHEQTKDYYKSLEKRAKEDNKKLICFYLTMNGAAAPGHVKFQHITYTQLYKKFCNISYDVSYDKRRWDWFEEFKIYLKEKLVMKNYFPELSDNMKVYAQNAELLMSVEKEKEKFSRELTAWLMEKLPEISGGKYKFSTRDKNETWWQMIMNDEWVSIRFHFEILWDDNALWFAENKVKIATHAEGRESRKEFEISNNKNQIEKAVELTLDFTTPEKAIDSLEKVIEILDSDDFQSYAQRADKLCGSIK